MRKTLVTILSLLLTVGFSASAFAGHAADTGYEYTPKLVKSGKSNIDLSGSIRIRGDFRDNVDFNSEDSDSRGTFDERLRIKLDATVSPNTMGVIELENGLYTGGDTYTWGDFSNARGTYTYIGNNGDGNYKPDGLTIRQAYIAHQGSNLLGTLSGFKAGHILTKLGNGVFYNHSKYGDDAIVLWTVPAKGTEVSLTMAKLGEGVNTSTDDATSYTVAATTGMNGINLGADVTYIDDQDYVAYLVPGTITTNGLHLWNLGLNAKAEVSGIALYGDLEVQSGKAKEGYNSGTPTMGDMKFKGYAWVLGAKADVPNSPIAAGLEAGYGSGDRVEECVNPPACTVKNSGNKNEGFLTTIGTSGNVGVRQQAYLYDDKVATAGSGLTYSGLSNMWYVNLGAEAKINPDLKLALDIFYMRAAKARAIGGALEFNGADKTSKNIGTEVDAKLTYQVDTNLVYYVEGGYLFAGSMYDYDDRRTPAATLIFGDNLRADNPYGIRHGLELTF